MKATTTTLILLFIIGVWCTQFPYDGMTDSQLRSEFVKFQQNYHRIYRTVDAFEKRFEIFKDNLKEASRLQKLNPMATFGITKFSDFTSAEFRQSLVPKHHVPKPTIPFSKALPNCNPNPTNWNWADCGVITDVYNQGQCGGAVLFAVTETIESYCALAGALLEELSVQELIDCCGNENGCDGESPEQAVKCIMSIGGIESSQTYPYISEQGNQCNFKINMSVPCYVTGYVSITGELGIYQQASTASGGPVLVCVDASTWASYSGGILTQCGDNIDHCVQLTGYSDYGHTNASWTLRNSWGTDWGENGYIQIAIGHDLCGVGDEAAVVTVKL